MWRNLWHVLKVDIFLANEKNPDVRNISVGHNTMAALSYLALFLIALAQVFTGFGLYSSMSGWWLPKLFAWVVPFLGGDFMVRTIHHSVTWLFILFTLIHVYLVFYHDWLEGRGEVSSMFGGYKFVSRERLSKNKVNITNVELPKETEPKSVN
jgi:Ni/Fe-hydrogenase 1 B-type cytochrome subunit